MGEPEVIPFPNRHPADELAAIRKEMRELAKRESELRVRLMLLPESERRGHQYCASIATYEQNHLNMQKLRRALGAELLKPFMYLRVVHQLRLNKNQE